MNELNFLNSGGNGGLWRGFRVSVIFENFVFVGVFGLGLLCCKTLGNFTCIAHNSYVFITSKTKSLIFTNTAFFVCMKKCILV